MKVFVAIAGIGTLILGFYLLINFWWNYYQYLMSLRNEPAKFFDLFSIRKNTSVKLRAMTAFIIKPRENETPEQTRHRERGTRFLKLAYCYVVLLVIIRIALALAGIHSWVSN